MKELSIEEKAKAYDEAVINGSRLWECDKITREDYEFIFPALEEGEDERIIGNIIATIHLYYGEPLEDEAKEMIAWLEKQGQTFTKKDVDDAYLKGVCDAKHELEKQGKNDMGISEATKRELEDKLHKALEKETAESFNKFLDEQKPADKVEPKFKVGDWVVYNDNLYHIGNIALQRYYECLRVDGTVHTFSLDIDSKSHLWTIQDAKDGDVLACGNDIVIFKENNYNPKDKSGCMFVYCSCNNFYEIGGINPTDYKPATKEQRELLFSKMIEAGYTWDAEKKELRKIEKKSADTEKGAKGNDREIPNSAWTEEDEKILNLIIARLHSHSNVDAEEYGKDYYWFKSLKERYTWKPSDLPHWKKSNLPNHTTTGFNSDYFCHKGYFINYKELFEKLPKDD